MIEHRAGGRVWRIAATRSPYTLPWAEFTALCRSVDVMISDRRLPAGCTPPVLARAGLSSLSQRGVAIAFRSGRVTMVRGAGQHPWLNPPKVQPPYAPAD